MIALPCVSPDGKPTSSGMTLLSSLRGGVLSPKEIAEKTGQPLFRVRSGLRELMNAEYVKEVDDKFGLTQKGDKILE